MSSALSRRSALKLGGLTAVGAAALTTPFGAGAQAKEVSTLSRENFPARYAVRIGKPQATAPDMKDGVARYDFTAALNTQAQVLTNPNLKTPVYGYNGTFPGPLIELERGTRAVVRIRNKMPPTGPFGSKSLLSTHLHGSASLPEYDGYANDVTPVNYYKDYLYPNYQPARTLWYHDHGVHFTAQQAYGGLAALYVLHDPIEREHLPQGEFDIPLMINDAMFNADGSLGYDDNSHSGLWGDVILVNGRPWPTMTVKRRTYRFRLLNCSISRSYKWRLSNGMPLQVVATDGGMMPRGVAVSSMRHAGAERYEVVIDFSKVKAGTRIELLNDSNPNNRDYDHTNKIMAFDVVGDAVDTNDKTWNRDYNGYALSSHYKDPVKDIMTVPTSGNYRRRSFRVERGNGIWQINGKSWKDVENTDFREVLADPGAGTTEIWDIQNNSGGWFHPLHIHLIDFRIIGRKGGVNRVLPHEEGPKDVVYVGEGETVSLLIRWDVNPETTGGHYMFHCHNLPHEDHDMMHQFRVGNVDIDKDPHHPVKAAPPKPL